MTRPRGLGHSCSRLVDAAPFPVQFVDLPTKFVADPLAALARKQVADMRLAGADLVGDLPLGQARGHQIGNFFFPHGATIANTIPICNSNYRFSDCYRRRTMRR